MLQCVQGRFTGSGRVPHESRTQYTDLSGQDTWSEAVMSRLQERAGPPQGVSTEGQSALLEAEHGVVILQRGPCAEAVMLRLQERAGLAQVVPQGGAGRLLGAGRAGGNACAGPGAGAAAGQIPSAHPELPCLLQGVSWTSPAHLSFACNLLSDMQNALPVGHAAQGGC